MSGTLYHEINTGKVQIALVATVGFGIAAMLALSAPWYVPALWVAATLALLWILASTGRAGIRIDDRTLTLRIGHQRKVIPLDEIDHIRVSHPFDGGEIVTLFRTDGDSFALPPGALPPVERLSIALMTHGIPVRRMG